MPMPTPRVFIGLLWLFWSVSQNGFADDDSELGRELALEYCVRCHDVKSDGQFKQHPPSFSAIAIYRSEEQIRGRILYPPTHTSMPQMMYYLTPENVEYLVAYIMSLESN